MEETTQNIITKATPPILDIKPVEELENVKMVVKNEVEDTEVMSDIKTDEIFIRPPKPSNDNLLPVVKKKKPLSERQKAHMEKMRKARADKLAKKRAEQPQKKPKTITLKEPIQIPAEPRSKLNNQEYLNEFFNNMNTFMDAYTKVEKVKRPTNNAPQPEKKQNKPYKQALKATPADNNSYSIDFLKPSVKYNNYKDPFGF
tara:strand:+ start:537 stop:1139 length:603 start_codon:yes stop_codon:yes gene_type:complete